MLAKIVFFGARAVRCNHQIGNLHRCIERAVGTNVPDDLIVIIFQSGVDGKAFGNYARRLILHVAQGEATLGSAFRGGFENTHRYVEFAALGHGVRTTDDQQHGGDVFHGNYPPATRTAHNSQSSCASDMASETIGGATQPSN
ncbi:hypothetical protein MESS2_1480016 [Mesorhizobium metallidurans STM 2683]|uniref:Uncharacterized protein n=1 Tax=Mesorhizobium metallidurans STM 2683 TaxID=1297569 RepID=M5ELD1_9HYPH|nr:hypothetical protein MESS2_1480016 [Mesorhizobium metallidurans STM 2683]